MHIYLSTRDNQELKDSNENSQGTLNQNELDDLRSDQKFDKKLNGIEKINDTVEIMKYFTPPQNTAFPEKNRTFFFTADWSGKLNIFTSIKNENTIILNIKHEFKNPIFSADWNYKGDKIYVGLANGEFYEMSFDLGFNEKIITLLNDFKSSFGFEYFYNENSRNEYLMVYENNKNLIRFYNVSNGVKKFLNQILFLKSNPICSDSTSGEAIFGLANGEVFILTNIAEFYIKNNADIELPNANSAYFTPQIGPINCVAISPVDQKYAIGSVEGRVSIVKYKIEEADSSVKSIISSNDITFRAHRSRKNNPTTGKCDLFQVNKILFHKKYKNMILTLGSDSILYLWNMLHRNKVFEFQYGGIPVTTCDINSDFTEMIYGLGYDWCLGTTGINSVEYDASAYYHKFKSEIVTGEKFN